MDWATAAAIVSDRTPGLSDAPDAPGDDDAFWAEVEQLVNGDGDLSEAGYQHKDTPESFWERMEAIHGPDYKQPVYTERLHPRDRTGKWMAKLGLKGLREVGGAPRDDLLGKQPKDIDYMAMETPERIKAAVEAQPGAEAEDLMVRDRLVGVRATHPDLPDGGVEIVPPRVEQSTGTGRKDFAIVPHPGLDGTWPKTPAEIPKRGPYGGSLEAAGGTWLAGGGCAHLALMLKSVYPEMKIATEWYDDHGRRGVGHAVAYDPATGTGYDVFGSDPVQYKLPMHGGTVNWDQDPQELADAMEIKWTPKDPWADPGMGEAEAFFTEHFLGHTPEQMTADDAMRRDFTVNAIYRDPQTGELTDPTGHGIEDARNHVLRMVHDQSFQEDPLRMLRGARFASQHALEPDPVTLAAMRRDSGGMTALTQKGVSGTVQEELRKILMSDNPGVGLRLMRDTGMLQTLLPELAPIVGFDQRSMYHEHVLDEHTFEVIDELARQNASYEARLAALFHDSGKPLTAHPKPDGTFGFHSHPVYGSHQDIGAEIARTTLTRLNFPRDTIDHVSDLVREHMVTAVEKPTPVKARRLRARFGDRFLNDLLDHKAADMEGHGEHIAINRLGIQKLRDLLAENADAPRSLKDLMINGDDLIAAGVKPGPELGKILRQLLTEVINQPDLNRREWLLGRAEKLAALPTQEWAELEEEAELEEADIYTEALHPRDRLGRWLTKEFGEQLAQPGNKRGRKPRPYRAARWIDTGQDFHTMAHEAARLVHPDGSHEEHAEIVKAVLADKPLPRGMSQQTRDATKKLRDNSTPTGPWGRYIYRLHGISAAAHADQTDKGPDGGKPYIQHVEAVADSVSDDAKPVALFHDALEDTQLTPEVLKQALTEPGVTTPEQAQEMVNAIKLLTRDHRDTAPGAYDRYIKGLKTADGRAGELAREVKRADLQHNIGRIGDDASPELASLKPRYEKALKDLAPTRAPITQRGKPVNRNDLDEEVVYERLLALYEASEDAGTAEIEKHWYATAHEQIEQLAKDNDIDPHTLAAMVAATSPQLTWRHEFKDKDGEPTGEVKFPNLDLAMHAASLARKYPDEPAPKLVERLVEASVRRTPEERKEGPSELGGLGESVLKAVRIYRGEDPERVLGAPKTRSFANNLDLPRPGDHGHTR